MADTGAINAAINAQIEAQNKIGPDTAAGLGLDGAFSAPLAEMVKTAAKAQTYAATLIDMNRAAMDGWRTALRRQQDLAIELAQEAMRSWAAPAPASAEESAETVDAFGQAGRAWQAMSFAMLEAQIAALRASQQDPTPVKRCV